MRYRICNRFRLLFVFIFAFLIMSLSVSAADSHTGWKAVNTVSDLSSGVSDGHHLIAPGDYYLTNDIVLEDYFIVESGPVNICLHGHMLKTTSEFYTIIIRKEASLTIKTCGSGEGYVINTKNTPSAAAIYVAGKSYLTVIGATIQSAHGPALDLNTGFVNLQDASIEGGYTGAVVKNGTFIIKESNIWGRTKYGIEIAGVPSSNINVMVQGGTVAGSGGAIYSSNKNTGSINVHVEGGEVAALVSTEPCIYLAPENGKITLDDGKFYGRFASGMNVAVTGGLYNNNSIAAYVPSGYICAGTDEDYYAYEVRKKRSYTVTFTDGMGNVLDEQTVAEGSSASAPQAPSRKGYDFNGWDRSFKNLSGTTTSITVNAKWKAGKTVVDLKKVKGLKLKAGKKKITVRWTKPSAKVRKTFSVYEVQYSLKKNFSDAKKIQVRKSASKVTLKNLKAKKKYYVRITVIKEKGGTIHRAKWTVKSTKTK